MEMFSFAFAVGAFSVVKIGPEGRYLLKDAQFLLVQDYFIY